MRSCRSRSEPTLTTSAVSVQEIGHGSGMAPIGGQSHGLAAGASKPDALGKHHCYEILVAFSTSRQSELALLLRNLERGKNIKVVGRVVGDPESFLAGLAESQPQVALLDGALVKSAGLQWLEAVRAYLPATRLIVLLSTPLASDQVGELMAKGFNGCLAIDSPAELYTKAVHAVFQGEFWFPRWVMADALSKLMSQLEQHDDIGLGPAPWWEGASIPRVTDREEAIFTLVRQGLTNKEIGRELGISDGTVKKHLKQVFNKLGFQRRAHALKCPSTPEIKQGSLRRRVDNIG